MNTNPPEKMDKRHHYFLILDCETATVPFIKELDSAAQKKISLTYPLIYNIGWKIVDSKGREYNRRSFLISEVFSNPDLFNTAYYKDKRPLYVSALCRKSIDIVTWFQARAKLIADIEKVEAIGAYNAAFDYYRAIRFTDRFIEKSYSTNFAEWYEQQRAKIVNVPARKGKSKSKSSNQKEDFTFHGIKVPIFDIWFLACKYLMNTNKYRNYCLSNNHLSESGKYYSTSAETAYRFIKQDEEFNEAHTAIEDADIESEILAHILKRKGKIEIGIKPFPFQLVGRVE